MLTEPNTVFNHMVELAQQRACQQVDKIAYTFLADGETPTEHISYAQLDAHAKAMAMQLRQITQPQERALLLFHSGLEFIVGFFACLYAGVIAVPLHPPKRNRSIHRLKAIQQDAQASIVLTTQDIFSSSETWFVDMPELKTMIWHCVELNHKPDISHWSEPAISGDTLAFLQYTSGSTSTPKGVMVSHANLLLNIDELARCFAHQEDSIIVSWLPLFHDLGLIYGLLVPFYMGTLCYFMSPASFLQRPIRWLTAISRFRATHSAAPNFAYELCLEKINDEQRIELDLSCWQMACNAAEPVHPETLTDFSKIYQPFGFDENAFCASYGLAEATLKVSISTVGKPTTIKYVDALQLTQNKIQWLPANSVNSKAIVGCGRIDDDTQSLIVDPNTRIPCDARHIGEIWVHGPSIPRGYWDREQQTQETFHAYLANTDHPTYLRTGDLGFIWQNELFVTGRLKDLIIIDGMNHYPQDIEKNVEQCHAALAAGCGAAFSIEVDNTERLVIVQEVKRTARHQLDTTAITAAIRQTIAEQHDIQLYGLALVAPLKIFKTTSGKIQRQACRAAWLDGSLATLHHWMLPSNHLASEKIDLLPSQKTIEDWLIACIAKYSGCTIQDVDPQQTFAYYGMGSRDVVGLTGELGQQFGCQISPTTAYDFPLIAQFAKHITDRCCTTQGKKLPTGTISETQYPATHPQDEAIAIVGMGCRFPGSDHPQALWQLLAQAMDAITEIPHDRWQADQYYHPDPGTTGKMNTRWGGFLKQVDQFDPQFFGISPREAETMDPQQRLLLEVSWEALEHAGILPASLAGTDAGVFIGMSGSEFQSFSLANADTITTHSATGGAPSIAAGRLAYHYDLRGPALAIDTACSSSLVAVHQACEALQASSCQLALAGGVNIILNPHVNIALSQNRMLASDGRCKSFDAAADGYVRGEGCGMIILKRLADARQAGDTVLAIIRGSAVNQDGHSNGLTAPNGPSQQAVIRQALQRAKLQPSQIRYVEAHGTGTALGDPIELNTLRDTLNKNRDMTQTCSIGSIKTNIGHLEAAAGIAGLIKTVLALQHRQIPPSLHQIRRNPLIELDHTPLHITQTEEPWNDHLYAGVSSLGFSGTNAHVILEGDSYAAPTTPSEKNQTDINNFAERSHHLITLAATSQAALQALCQQHTQHLEKTNTLNMADYAYSVNTTRTAFNHRLAMLCTNTAQASSTLSQLTNDDVHGTPNIYTGIGKSKPKIAFLFTGQGAQYPGMAKNLYASESVFRQVLDQCDSLLTPILNRSILPLILGTDPTPQDIHQTQYTQPALFSLEVALARLWLSWRIQPSLVLGHSVGEYSAAHIAGLFSLESGLTLIAERARLMQTLPRGSMAAILASPTEIAEHIDLSQHSLSIAAINGPNQTVISGAADSLDKILQQLTTLGMSTQRLNVSHAFHSPMMVSMIASLTDTLKNIRFQSPIYPIISNVSGQFAGDDMATSQYWCDHTLRPVQFQKSIETAFQNGINHFLEIGPDATLLAMAKRCVPKEKKNTQWLTSLKKDQDDHLIMLQSLGQLYCSGATIDWQAFDKNRHRQRLTSLPTYPFQRKRYWPSTSLSQDNNFLKVSPLDHPLLGHATPLAKPCGQIYTQQLNQHKHGYLLGHRVTDWVVFPGAAYVEMALSAANKIWPNRDIHCNAIHFDIPLIINELSDCCLQSHAIEQDNQTHTLVFSVFSRQQSASHWSSHMTSTITSMAPASQEKQHLPNHEERQSFDKQQSGNDFYDHWQQRGNQWQDAFQGIQQLWLNDIEAWALIEIPATISHDLQPYSFHPAVLDSCAQVLAALCPQSQGAFVGQRIQSFELYQAIRNNKYWVHATLPADNTTNKKINHTVTGDILILDEKGHLVAKIDALTFTFLETVDPAEQCTLFETHWQAFNSSTISTDFSSCKQIIFSQDDAASSLLALAMGTASDNPVIAMNCVSSLEQEFATEQTIQVLFIADTIDTHYRTASTITDQLVSQLQTLVQLSHIIQSTAAKANIKLWIVTQGALRVPLSKPITSLNTEANALWGFARTLALEISDTWGGLIDLDPTDPADLQAESLQMALQYQAQENQIAIRQAKLFGARLQPLPFPTRPPELNIPGNASYLITGGLGDLGLHWASWLAKQGARCLILISRSELPARATWQQGHHDAMVSKQIAAIENIEQMGTQVILLSMDVSHEIDFQQCLTELKDTVELPIRGVIHAAGIANLAFTKQLTHEIIHHQLAAKIIGSLVLDRFFTADDLDFMLLFSSISASLPSPQLAVYAAANAWLDGLATQRRQNGAHCVSIQWDAFADIGLMARHLSAHEHNPDTHLAPDIASNLTPYFIESPKPVIGVAASPASLDVTQSILSPAYFSAFTHHNASEKVSESLKLDALIPLTSDQKTIELTHWLRIQLASILKSEADHIDESVPLTHLGLDSLMALEIRNRIKSTLSIDLPAVELIRGPSLLELSQILVEKLSTESQTASKLISVDSKQPFPLAYSQQAQWFLHQINPHSAAYHVSFAARLHSPLDHTLLAQALNGLIQRHASLRTVFDSTQNPQQHSQSQTSIQVDWQMVADMSDSALESAVKAAYAQPFDLKKAPLLRAHVFQRSPTDQILLIVAHHIACDGWSLWILLDELQAFFQAHHQQKALSLAKLPHNFADFVHWQKNMLDSAEGEKQWHYWQKQLSGTVNILSLPTDHPRPAIHRASGASLTFQIPGVLSQQLRDFAKAQHVTLFTLLISVYQVLLYRYTEQKDILVGTPTTGRSQAEFTDIVGDFVNVLPIRCHIQDQCSFSDLLTQQQKTILDALSHADFPLPLMVERLQLPRDSGRPPLVQTVFIMQKPQKDHANLSLFLPGQNDTQLHWGDLVLSPYVLPQQEGQFDLTIEIADNQDQLAGFLKYDNTLFEKNTIERLRDHYLNLLAASIKHPDQPIHRLALLTEQENHQLKLFSSADNVIPRPIANHTTIIDRFVKMVNKRPHITAIADQQHCLTYSELNQSANHLAHRLLQQGKKTEQIIGVCLDRNIDLISGLLGILKSGAAYLPLDAEHPEARLAFQIQDAKITTLVTQQKYLSKFSTLTRSQNIQLICLDDPALNKQPDHNPEVEIHTKQLAYVIYTSGSTGQPKGTLIEHGSVINLVDALHDLVYHRYLDPIRVAMVANVIFDASVQQVFGTLLHGHTLQIIDVDTRRDGWRLAGAFEQHQITVADCTPSLLSMMVTAGFPWTDECALDYLLVGGEPLATELVQRFYAQQARTTLINVYGPTECCVDVSAYPIDRHALPSSEIIPLGRPLRNTQLYVLDATLSPVPIGVPGEIYVAGPGLSRGYLHRPELTTRHFVSVPELTPELTEARLYRTGDQARWLADGRLQFLGRLDDQVKIRGHRIELTEIENQLCNHPNVQNAIVTIQENHRLIAHVIPATDFSLTEKILQQSLAAALPHYMVPQDIVFMEQFPLTSSGKIDKRSLPTATVSTEVDHVAPQGDFEKTIAGIWCEILQRDQVSRHDNFFDLGGHSLLLAHIQQRLMSDFGMQIDMVDLFSHPTVLSMSQLLTPDHIDPPVQSKQRKPRSGGLHQQRAARLSRRTAVAKDHA